MGLPRLVAPVPAGLTSPSNRQTTRRNGTSMACHWRKGNVAFSAR